MQKIVASLALTASLLLIGCSGTTSRVLSPGGISRSDKVILQIKTLPDASEEGMTILRERLQTQLASRGVLADVNDTAPRVLEVTLTGYYVRHGATRHLAGIMAGRDNIISTVRVRQSDNGNVLSEFTVQSKNASTWKTARSLIEEHADSIVNTLLVNRQ